MTTHITGLGHTQVTPDVTTPLWRSTGVDDNQSVLRERETRRVTPPGRRPLSLIDCERLDQPEAPPQLTRILPALRPAGSSTYSLSDQGFPAEIAQLTLSPQLVAVFSDTTGLLSTASLFSLDVSLMTVWNNAALNLQEAASDGWQIRFLHRPATTVTKTQTRGIEMRCTGGQSTAWLAHPETFRLIYRHAGTLLDTEPVFFAPTEDCLVVAPVDENLTALKRWARWQYAENPARHLSPDPLRYCHGFPRSDGS